jgi:rhomboid protease GluP
LNNIDHSDPTLTPADFSVATPLPVEGEVIPVAGSAGDDTRKGDRAVSLWDYPATYTLLAINIIVFALMVWYGHLWHAGSGTNFLLTEFDVRTLIVFGGSQTDFVLQGNQWWRLVTSTFVHGSLLHIALNMWCLWNLGVFGEPLLGRRGLICVYLLTGTAGMMFSLAWSAIFQQSSLVVGASGAVFGIAGILIVLLSNRKLALPWEELRGLRRQVIFFAVANLVIGMAPGFAMGLPASAMNHIHLDPANLPRIDNTAHLGGLLSGLALGLPLFPRMTSGKQSYRQRQTITFVTATLLLCLIGYAVKRFSAN